MTGLLLNDLASLQGPAAHKKKKKSCMRPSTWAHNHAKSKRLPCHAINKDRPVHPAVRNASLRVPYLYNRLSEQTGTCDLHANSTAIADINPTTTCATQRMLSIIPGAHNVAHLDANAHSRRLVAEPGRTLRGRASAAKRTQALSPRPGIV